MENYIQLGCDMVVPEYEVSVVGELSNIPSSNVIFMIDNVLQSCPSPNELKDNLVKRLSGSKSSTVGVDLCVVAMMCLASCDYSVSHVSLCDVSERDMLKVWSNLERQTVSSTYLLRQWTRSRIGTRTCEGYMANWNLSRNFGPTSINTSITAGSWRQCVDITVDAAYKVTGQPTTVLEAVHDDVVTSSKISLLLLH